jgi:hypothetical protein
MKKEIKALILWHHYKTSFFGRDRINSASMTPFFGTEKQLSILIEREGFTSNSKGKCVVQNILILSAEVEQ